MNSVWELEAAATGAVKLVAALVRAGRLSQLCVGWHGWYGSPVLEGAYTEVTALGQE